MKSTKKVFPHKIEYYNERGYLHRIDGPAVEWIFHDGSKEWWINGKLHREDGPAVEYYNGIKLWYLNDKLYWENEWKQEVTKIKLKRILDL
jgi:hypothetical protein